MCLLNNLVCIKFYKLQRTREYVEKHSPILRSYCTSILRFDIKIVFPMQTLFPKALYRSTSREIDKRLMYDVCADETIHRVSSMRSKSREQQNAKYGTESNELISEERYWNIRDTRNISLLIVYSIRDIGNASVLPGVARHLEMQLASIKKCSSPSRAGSDNFVRNQRSRAIN